MDKKSGKIGNKSNIDNVETSTSGAAATTSDGELSEELSSLDIASSNQGVSGIENVDGSVEAPNPVSEGRVKFSDKSSRKKKKSDKNSTPPIIAAVKHTDTMSAVGSVGEGRVYYAVSDNQAGSLLESKYLQEGAKPKMRQPVASRQTKGAKKTDIVQSDVQKDVSARSSDILSNIKQGLKSSFPKSFDRSNTKARSVESGERQGVPSESAVEFVTKTLAEADLRVKESEIRKSSQRGKAEGLHDVSSGPCDESVARARSVKSRERQGVPSESAVKFVTKTLAEADLRVKESEIRKSSQRGKAEGLHDVSSGPCDGSVTRARSVKSRERQGVPSESAVKFVTKTLAEADLRVKESEIRKSSQRGKTEGLHGVSSGPCDGSVTKARSVKSGERQGVPSESAVKFVTKTLAEADLRVKESEIRKSSQRGKAEGLHGVSSGPCDGSVTRARSVKSRERQGVPSESAVKFVTKALAEADLRVKESEIRKSSQRGKAEGLHGVSSGPCDESVTKARSVKSGERQGVPSESAIKFVTKTLAEADLRVKESEIRKSSQRGKAQGLHGVSSKPCGEGSIEVVDYREEKRRARVEDVQGFFGGYLKTSTGKERESRSLEDVTVVKYVRREGDCGVVSREDRKSEVDNGYLQQGAKPKICRSYSIKQRKDTDAIPSCVHREVESSEKLPGVSEGQKTQVLTSVEASTHMTTESFIRRHTSHLSAKEYFQQMVKFRKTVKQFADMHFVYSANFMFNIFNIVGNRLVLKPEIQNSLLKVTNNINLCTFIIKLGIIEQMVVRLCNLVILKYFKYCASHYYDQSHMDAFLISLINLGFSDLKTISARVRNFLYCYSQELKDKAVFKVHSNSFYYDMLGMYIDIVNSRVQDTQLNDLIDLIKVSCIVQFGHMYHIIVQSKNITTESCTDKEIQALIFQERSVKHMLFYAVRFERICDNARMAFSHLYGPDEKRNPVCVTSGLAFPRNIIRPCREIINDIDHNVKNGTMHFGVFMSNIANYTTSLFLNSELEFLIRKDIETYGKVIAEQYLIWEALLNLLVPCNMRNKHSVL
ncbi:DUF3514 domain-containing protein [Ehrlichia canis]|uniref:DUF3514 domain-containing protein n=1 Tax=Ehrlichia canis TaxID=944 RepID=UPI001F36CC89|nr:DUF3514 domain-containing protein [Ehrlichia canis]UKC52981.1 DUF3514 domain-containing protein [Ehrlichia canis]UKC53918.1 DUF3514 domain-containing protein [Ehrlichia canis]UKC54854.1 DUF3514 domain-containing protein [Ehrlichia canis]